MSSSSESDYEMDVDQNSNEPESTFPTPQMCSAVGQSSMPTKSKFTDFFNPNQSHDTVLTIEGKNLYVQSEILKRESTFFSSWITGGEGNDDQIFEGLKADDFNLFLRAISDKTFIIQDHNLKPLIALAQRFTSGPILEACKKKILNDFELLDKNELLEIVCTNEGFDDIQEKIEEYFVNQDVIPCEKNFHFLTFKYSQKELQERLKAPCLKPEEQIETESREQKPKTIIINTDDFGQLNIEMIKERFSALEGKYHNGSVVLNLVSSVTTHLTLKDENGDQIIFESIWLTDGKELIEFFQPGSICMDLHAVHTMANWQFVKTLKFATKVSMKVEGHGDNWSDNASAISEMLGDAVSKMVEEKAELLFISVSKLALSIIAQLPSTGPEDEVHWFKLEVIFFGLWNLPTSYGHIFPNMLKKVVKIPIILVLDFPCKNCTESMFNSMNWKFDEDTADIHESIPYEELPSILTKSSDYRDNSFYEEISLSIRSMSRSNSLVGPTGEVLYYFLKEKENRNKKFRGRLEGKAC